MSTDAAGSTGVPGADASPFQGTGAWAAAGAPYRWRWAAFALWAAAGLQMLTFALAFLLRRKASPAAQDWPAGSHDGEAGT